MQLLYHPAERTDKWNQSTARLQIPRNPYRKNLQIHYVPYMNVRL
jgi:hypothetical protein